MTVEPVHKCTEPARSKKPDYLGAIVVNAVVLVIVNQILNWGFLPFLTQDFKQVLFIQNISLVATIVFNAVYLFYDAKWFTGLLGMVINSLGVAVVLKMMIVFPFDFAAYSGFNWAVLARVMLWIGLVGCVIGMIAEAFKFASAMISRK